MQKIGFIILATICMACGSSSFETKNGTTVTYLRKGDGGPLQDSTISFFYLKYETENGSEIFQTPEPSPMRLGDSFTEGNGELFQALQMMNIGDSVRFGIPASDFFEKTMRAPLPDTISSESNIIFFASLVKQQTEEEYYVDAAINQKELLESYIDSVQLNIDRATLDNFYADNNVDISITTENGVGIKITEEGSGPKPKMGQSVTVNYSGYMLDGRDFDSGSYPFKIYLSQVILGWHEGIIELSEGTKATIYIPSPLGYGPRKRSEIIVENSILVFDIELVKVGE